jgi:hypothetical protein
VTDTYITIIGSVVGDPQAGYRTVYNWDGTAFPAKSGAIDNGFAAGRSDDFNVGIVRDGKLLSLWWMDKQFAHDPETIAAIAHEIGLAG